jgi:hypothetical protein
MYILQSTHYKSTIALTLPVQYMSHHTATVQIFFEKVATTYDAVLLIIDRIYWIDETYVQHFYVWIAPRLQDACMSGLYWALVALFETAL